MAKNPMRLVLCGAVVLGGVWQAQAARIGTFFTASAPNGTTSGTLANFYDGNSATDWQGSGYASVTFHPDRVYDVTSFTYADSSAQNMLNEVGLCSPISKSNVRYTDTSTPGNPMTVAYTGRVGIFRFYAPLEGLVGGVNPGGADFYLNGTPALSPQGSPYMRLTQDPAIMGSSSAAYSPGYALDKIFDRSVRVDGNGADEYAVGMPGQCHVDLDFGAATLVQFVDVWNRQEKQITDFSLVFSNNADFSSPLATVAVSGFELATLVNVTGQGPGGTDLTARYLRFQSTATSGNQYSGIGEMAFYAVVPEPATLALVAVAAAWCLAPRRRADRR